MASTVTSTPVQTISAEVLEEKLGFGIWYSLSAWDAMRQAISGQWGGPDSEEKRDYLAGSLTEILTKNPTTTYDEVQEIILQYMADEFDVDIEDDSEEKVVAEVIELWKQVRAGEEAMLGELKVAWETKSKEKAVKMVKGKDQESEDEDSVDGESESEDEDVEMGNAPTTKPQREKILPVVDEDGFTTVPTRRNR